MNRKWTAIACGLYLGLCGAPALAEDKPSPPPEHDQTREQAQERRRARGDAEDKPAGQGPRERIRAQKQDRDGEREGATGGKDGEGLQERRRAQAADPPRGGNAGRGPDGAGPGGPGRGGPRDGRPDGAGRSRPPEGGNIRASYERLIKQLPDALELTAAQRPEFDRLTAAFMNTLKQADDNRGERDKLRRAYREALEAGDQQQAEELRRQMRGSGDVRTAARDFFDDLEAILTPEQTERLAEFRRQNRARVRQGPGDVDQYRELLKTLPQELKLDGKQKGAYADMAESFGRELDRQQTGWQRLRELQREMREASEAGDEARVAELRREAEAARSDSDDAATAFFDQLNGILREDQQGLLAEIRTRMGDHNAAPPTQRSLQALIRAVRELELPDDVRKETRAIVAEGVQQMRAAAPEDATERQRIYKECYDKVSKRLNAEQRAELDKALSANTGQRPSPRGQTEPRP